MSNTCKYLKHIFKDDEQSDGKYADIVGCCGQECHKKHKFVIDKNCFKVDNIIDNQEELSAENKNKACMELCDPVQVKHCLEHGLQSCKIATDYYITKLKYKDAIKSRC